MTRLGKELAGLEPWSGWKWPKEEGSSSKSKSESNVAKRGGAKTGPKSGADTGAKVVKRMAKKPAKRDSGYVSANSEPEQTGDRAPRRAQRAENQLKPVSEEAHTISGGANNTSGYAGGPLNFDVGNVERRQALHINLERLAIDREEADDTIMVSSSQTEAVPSAGTQPLGSVQPEQAQSAENGAAIAGPKCPLCECPVYGVCFIVVECEICGRSYHQECISYEQCVRYHPFDGLITSGEDGDYCKGCGCPDGDSLNSFAGFPGILFHRRDQDPEFEEYFREGSREEAKSAHLESRVAIEQIGPQFQFDIANICESKSHMLYRDWNGYIWG